MTPANEKPENPSSLTQLTFYFLKLGTTGFGDIIALPARDVPTALMALGSLLILIYTKIPEPLLVCATGLMGLFLYKG